ncbi:hypothetical protein Rcae01_01038 [Novipirellula caenicola]|uniref:Uncharacterized protein n=1 Tax=Novipirellula caenicola TaxID=1536901 RepID=A0ABP9VN38_9BACT
MLDFPTIRIIHRTSQRNPRTANDNLHRRSGLAKLGHHNVNRRIAVTSTVTRLSLLNDTTLNGTTMLRLLALPLVIGLGIVRCANLDAQDGGGGIACGVTLELDYVASVLIQPDVTRDTDLADDSNPVRRGKAPITLTLIDQTSKASPFLLSVWTKSNIDRSKLRLIVIDDKDALVAVLQSKVQFSEREQGQLVTFSGSLTKDCAPTSRIHVVQLLSSKGFCRPFVHPRNEEGG